MINSPLWLKIYSSIPLNNEIKLEQNFHKNLIPKYGLHNKNKAISELQSTKYW